jgi:gamma-glutamylcyclotransferase (GGCT)/AIG2-like uncharacterized protein YtfP
MAPNGPVSQGDLFAFYGLLMEGSASVYPPLELESGGTFGAPCWLRGTLLDMGNFPALVPGDGLVRAQRYVIDRLALANALDAFEDLDPAAPDEALYHRLPTPLLASDGAATGETAWVYWLNPARPADFPIVASGAWPPQTGLN